MPNFIVWGINSNHNSLVFAPPFPVQLISLLGSNSDFSVLSRKEKCLMKHILQDKKH